MKVAARTLFLVTLVVGGLIVKFRPSGPQRPANVLIIVADTLRADRLAVYGNRQGITPFLDQWAAQSVVFRHAYAASSWTSPSISSLFTSRYPSQHGVINLHTGLSEDEQTLAETLRAHGYETAAFVTNAVLGAAGYPQGFNVYRQLYNEPPKTRAATVHREAVAWLDQQLAQAPETPIFLYLHFMEPHWPYVPGEVHRKRFAPEASQRATDLQRASRKLNAAFGQMIRGIVNGLEPFTCDDLALLESMYNAEVADLDAELATLFEAFARRGFLEHTIVIVTADHGEEFLDHGNVWHGYTLYNESIQVPLLVRLPGQQRGWTANTPTSLVDIAPTLAALVRSTTPEGFIGRSFAGALTRPVWLQAMVDRLYPPQPIVAQLEPNPTSAPRGRLHAAALWRGGDKLLTRPDETIEVYDLASDPLERRPARSTQPDLERQLVETLENANHDLRQQGSMARGVAIDATTRGWLEALGYAEGPPDVDVSPMHHATARDTPRLLRSQCVPIAEPPPSPSLPARTEAGTKFF